MHGFCPNKVCLENLITYLASSNSIARKAFVLRKLAIITSAEGEVKDSRRSGMYQGCIFTSAEREVKVLATLRNVSKLQFFDRIGHAKSVGIRFHSAI